MVWNTGYFSQLHNYTERFDIYQLDLCPCRNIQIIPARKSWWEEKMKVWMTVKWRCFFLFYHLDNEFHKIKFQLLKLITIIKNSERERLSKALIEERELPEHMKQFFLPAEAINPSQFKGRRGKTRKLERLFCYTHTMILNGQCVVMCDTTIIKPCW